MIKGILPDDPCRADHRFIRFVLNTFFKKKKVLHDPAEFDRVTRVFARAGGSWERLFGGSEKDVNLLKRVLKIAIKTGHISEAPQLR